ncbi:prepilin-type N-terminal cleavage/methylation domain-containing protein [Alteromonas macleodii]|uniref:prepilin-type N-terminal cleavage/methylation domain-containing protein n=1 Tax=Alteromonas macleodii TaxID=28108 RepID=UPI003140BC16
MTEDRNIKGGFSALELIVVVIIMGIIAITAIPKFVSLKGDDYLMSMQRTKSAVEGALMLVKTRAESQGVATGEGVLKAGKLSLNIENGYPSTKVENDLKSIVYWEDTDVGYKAFPSDKLIVIYPLKVYQPETVASPEDYNCSLIYKNDSGRASVSFTNKDKCKGEL